MRLFPPSANAKRLIVARALRAVADGYVSVLLPAYLLTLGLDAFEVGVLTTATLLGMASLTLLVGFITNRFGHRRPPLAAAALMTATGLGFAGLQDIWPLLMGGVRRNHESLDRRCQRLPAAGAVAARPGEAFMQVFRCDNAAALFER